MEELAINGVSNASILPQDDVVDAFRNSLKGQLIIGSDPEYDEARAIWNGMIDRRPAAIARCLGTVDVQTSLLFAQAHGLPVTIRGGGHNIAGLSVQDGALMIDMSCMRGVTVEPAKRTAHAQAGCLLGDVDRETQAHGLAAVLGFASTTGIAGLTLGGGFGYLTRQFGWTCDNVRSMEVVTARGELVTASKYENPDLFWGLRGGGGNFGIVTSFEYELYEVGPLIFGGAIAWSADEAPAVLEMYQELLKGAPPELTVVAGLRMAPPAPWINEEMHGKPIIVFFVCYTGTMERGASLLAPVKEFANPVGDMIQPLPYVQQQSLIDATQPHGRRYYWKSEYLPEVSTEMTEPLIRHAAQVASAHGAILIFPLDGKLNRLPDDHSAVGNRDTRLVINIAAGWDDAADDHMNITWARNAWEELRQFSTGGVYVNFLTEDEGDERTRAAYRTNYSQLVALKRKWDPTNVFRTNKNIRPH